MQASFAILAIVVVGFVQLCQGQCTPPSGPSCVIIDPRDSAVASEINPQFFQGIGITAPAPIYGNRVDVNIQNGGDIAAYDVAANCGFIFFALGRGPTITFTPADIANLQTFTSAGGLIVILCEWGGFDPRCASIMNPLITAVDPSCAVQYSAISVNPSCSLSPPTSTVNSFKTTPNDLTNNLRQSLTTSFVYPTSADPECLWSASNSPPDCVLAAYGQFLFFADINLIAGNCLGVAYSQTIGENVGAYVAACGGAGGDPHVFSFDGQQIDLDFLAGKKYLFYGGEDFRITIETSNEKDRQVFISAIGIKMHSNYLLAIYEDDPVFYYNGVQIEDSVLTPLGEAVVFVPEPQELHGALHELSKYVVTGLKIENFVEIVGGVYNSAPFGFFNIEVVRSHRSDFGLLQAVVNRRDRMAVRVSDFEITSLFE